MYINDARFETSMANGCNSLLKRSPLVMETKTVSKTMDRNGRSITQGDLNVHESRLRAKAEFIFNFVYN
jgi:hypothetical protein